MARKVIALRGAPPIVDEQDSAVDAITPGHLLEIVAGGVQKNTANAANVTKVFALEREEFGKDIDQAYAVGDKVKTGYFKSGDRVYAFLASGQNVAKGAYLTGDNAGQLTATGVTTALRLAQALEAVDNSAGANPRIRVVVI